MTRGNAAVCGRRWVSVATVRAAEHNADKELEYERPTATR
jgi:hypothetical protein